MSDYFAVLPMSPPIDQKEVKRIGLHSCLDIHRVDWLRSYLATDGSQMLCWYQALDTESVRHVVRQKGVPGAQVYNATVALKNSTDTNTDPMIIVEIDLRDMTVESVLSTLAEKLRIDASFASAYSDYLILAIESQNKSAVETTLVAAGVEVSATWPCLKIDPRPGTLFETPSAPRASGSTSAIAAAPDVEAIVIGAGLSGIAMLHRAIKMGLTVRAFDDASDVGGVWCWNRYPGARVDSETYTYGYSFSSELLDEWRWDELFSTQPEIHHYIRQVVDRFDLRRYISLNTRIERVVYDQDRRLWNLTTDSGEKISTRYVFMTTGSLSARQLPDYPGLDDFEGESHHTARWPSRDVELTGKRVGVIGTGASGVQVIQTIAAEVAHLTVFQRTPSYCIPQQNRPLTETDHNFIKNNWSAIMAACRDSYGGFIHTFDPRSGLSVDEAEREAKFEKLWAQPGFAFWFSNFADLMMNDEVNEHASDFVRRKIRARVHNPEIAAKLMPEHPFGTKRVPLENGYYEVYNQDNVHLIDLRETPITRITRHGIQTSDEEHELDVIVYATGFDVGTGPFTNMDIRGEGGLSIADKWRDGPQTFLGLMLHGFPNLFIINGPHNAAAICNATRCIEQNIDWIARCIEHGRARNRTRIAATAAAEQEWTDHVYALAEGSVFRKGRNSWFFGANTPGKPERVLIYTGGARLYREHCEQVAKAGFVGIEMS